MAQPSATVLIIGLPDKAFVGLDFIALTASPAFLGICDIPSGLHFIYAGRDSALSIRQGIWISATAPGPNESRMLSVKAGPDSAPNAGNGLDASEDVGLILQWNKETEALTTVSGDLAQNLYSRTGSQLSGQSQRKVYSFNELVHRVEGVSASNAEPHPRDALRDWSCLTNYLTQTSLTRILSGEMGIQSLWSLCSGSAAPCDQESIPGLDNVEAWQGRDLTLLRIDLKQTWPVGSQGIERTTAARDRSWRLQSVVQEADTISDGNRVNVTDQTDVYEDSERGVFWGSLVLGEMQFCFLMVLLLMNYSCLQQWRRILEVVLTSKDMIWQQPRFFRRFLKLLQLQLRNTVRVDGGLFEIEGNEGGAFLSSLVLRFRQNLSEILEEFRVQPVSYPSSDLHMLGDDLSMLTDCIRDVLGLELATDIVRRGTVMLEDGEEVEVQLLGADEEDEVGEYAPVVV